MLDLLLSIFGGFHYFGIISADKAIRKNMEKETEKQNEFHKKLCLEPEEEHYIEELLCNDESRMKTLASIAEELTEVFGVGWSVHFKDFSTYHCGVMCEPWGIAKNILASKKCKLSYMFSYSYPLGGLGKERMGYVINACKIIERNMQIEHPELKLIFHPGVDIGINGEKRWHESLARGELIWEHQMMPFNKKYNPPVKRLW